AHRGEWRRAIESQGFVRGYEVTLRRKDGSELTALETSMLTRDAAGNPETYQGFLLDITEKKLAEDELHRRNRQLAGLNAIATLATESFHLGNILEQSLAQIVELMALEAALIYLFDPESNSLMQRGVAPGKPLTEFTEQVLISAEALKKVHQSLEVLLPDNALQLPEPLRQLLRAAGVRSFAGVLLWSGERPIGLMVILGEERRSFSLDE